MPLSEGRDWRGRAFTIGIGGWVKHVIRVEAAPLTSKAGGLWQDGSDARSVSCLPRGVLDRSGHERHLHPVGDGQRDERR